MHLNSKKSYEPHTTSDLESITSSPIHGFYINDEWWTDPRPKSPNPLNDLIPDLPTSSDGTYILHEPPTSSDATDFDLKVDGQFIVHEDEVIDEEFDEEDEDIVEENESNHIEALDGDDIYTSDEEFITAMSKVRGCRTS